MPSLVSSNLGTGDGHSKTLRSCMSTKRNGQVRQCLHRRLFRNCQVGFDLTTGGLTQDTQTTGADVIIDAVVTNTPTFIRTSGTARTSLAGSLLLDNVKFTTVTNGVVDGSGNVVLAGGDKTIRQWAQGNVYTGTGTTGKYVQAAVNAPPKPSALVDSTGRVFSRSRPQYLNYATSRMSLFYLSILQVLMVVSRIRIRERAGCDRRWRNR